MQISPSLHSYEKAPRSPVYDRKPVASEQDESSAYMLRDGAITGSKAVLSSSLAEALWSIQRTSTDDERMSGSTIENLYLAYSE